jgi:hypothetical protein
MANDDFLLGSALAPSDAMNPQYLKIASPFLGLRNVGTYDVSTHVPSSVAATAANGTIIGCGGVWTTYGTAGAAGVKLLLSNACATGEFATVRFRARGANTTVSGNGGNSVGTTTCIDASASAVSPEYGNLKAVNACAQPNAAAQTVDATNIVCALYGRIDATAGSVGRRWVSWLDTHATTKAAASDFMERISHNGTIATGGVWTIYSGGRLPALFNFEDDIAGGFLTDTSDSLVTQSGSLKVITPAGMKYIPLYDHP